MFLRLPEILQIVGCSKSTWYSMVKNNLAPKQIVISKKYAVWRESDIIAWMGSKSS
jgi:predicted DNA-binding transcriptional regulator AlpA